MSNKKIIIEEEVRKLKKQIQERSYQLAREALPKLRDRGEPATPYNYLKHYEEGESKQDRQKRDLYESKMEEEILEKEAIKKLLEKYFFGIFKDKYDDILARLLRQTQKTKSTGELFENVAAILKGLIGVSHTQQSLKNVSERNASLKKFTTDIVRDMDKTVSQIQGGVASKRVEKDFAEDIESQLSRTIEKSKENEEDHKKKEDELTRILEIQKEAFEESIEELQEKLKETEQIVYIDALTEIFNRRAFDERVEEDLRRSLDKGKPCALALIDIDYFKKVNDKYGHQIGDQVLKHLAKIAMNNIKGFDYLARYGGEEFIAILPNTTYANAIMAAENIRRNIEEEDFTVRGKPIDITVSIGVSEVQHHNLKTVRDFIYCADEALYKAKDSGRNKVC